MTVDAALRALKAAGLRTASNINLNRLNQADFEPLYEELKQLGRAADRPAMLLQPWDLNDLVPRIAALKQRAFEDRIVIFPGNNLGYFGPEEGLMRSPQPGDARSLARLP